MQKIYLLVGLPGSGKSTWAKKKTEDENTIIICRDDIRTMLKGKYFFDKRYETLVKRMANSLLKQAIHCGCNVIIDETNVTRSARLKWVRVVNKMYIDFEYDLDVEMIEFPETPDIYERRRKDNKGYTEKRWDEIIDGMKKIYQSTDLDKKPDDVKVPVSARIAIWDELNA